MEEKITRALQALRGKGYTDVDLLNLLVPLLTLDNDFCNGDMYCYNPVGKYWLDEDDDAAFYYHVQEWRD